MKGPNVKTKRARTTSSSIVTFLRPIYLQHTNAKNLSFSLSLEPDSNIFEGGFLPDIADIDFVWWDDTEPTPLLSDCSDPLLAVRIPNDPPVIVSQIPQLVHLSSPSNYTVRLCPKQKFCLDQITTLYTIAQLLKL